MINFLSSSKNDIALKRLGKYVLPVCFILLAILYAGSKQNGLMRQSVGSDWGLVNSGQCLDGMPVVVESKDGDFPTNVVFDAMQTTNIVITSVFCNSNNFRVSLALPWRGLVDFYTAENFTNVFNYVGSVLPPSLLTTVNFANVTSSSYFVRAEMNTTNHNWDVDSDYDGISDHDELLYGTNPRMRDSDGDGLVDGIDIEPLIYNDFVDTDNDGIHDDYELYWYGSLSYANNLSDYDNHGFSYSAAIRAGIEAYMPRYYSEVDEEKNIISTQLFDYFGLPTIENEIIYEKVFHISRDQGWNKLFLSADPFKSKGWTLSGLKLEWNDGITNGCTSSSQNSSLYLPLSTNAFSVVLRLRATSSFAVVPQPLYLLTWAPKFTIKADKKVVVNNQTFYISLNDEHTVELEYDSSFRPCGGEVTPDEMSGVDHPLFSIENLVFDNGRLKATKEGIYEVPRNLLTSFQSFRARQSRQSSFGEGYNAVLREVEYQELCYDGSFLSSSATYWDNGKLRFSYGDNREWKYQAYNEDGLLSFKLEQRDGSNLIDDTVDWSTDNLPTVKCFLTTYDYTPLEGDDNNTNDVKEVRTEERYVVEGGIAKLIERKWNIYTRDSKDGYETIIHTAGRDASPLASASCSIGRDGSLLASASCSIGRDGSITTTFSHDDPTTPIYLRGKTIREEDENGNIKIYEYSVSNDILTTVEKRFFKKVLSGRQGTGDPTSATLVELPTRRITTEDLVYGLMLSEDEYEIAKNKSFGRVEYLYDNKNRLISTRYDDGSYSTNVYSCCRLLWSVSREGVKTRRSAVTGQDHLYYAMEEEYLAGLPSHLEYKPFDGLESQEKPFRVTQYFFDAMGRETNVVTRLGVNPGCATNMNFVYDKGWCTSESVEYPYGTSDYRISTDKRGLITVTKRDSFLQYDETVIEQYHPTNLLQCISRETRTIFRNGSEYILKEWDEKWISESREMLYDSNGCKTELTTTASSDYNGVVTNNISRFDSLLRLVKSETPLSSISYEYDGNSSRIHSAYDEKSGIATTYIYNSYGDQIGTLKNNTLNVAEVTYEEFSNNLWRVTSEVLVTDGVTNKTYVTKERLTNLSTDCVSQTITMLNGEVVSSSSASQNPSTSERIEVINEIDGNATTNKYKYGYNIESETTKEGKRYSYYDSFGRIYYVERANPNSSDRIPSSFSQLNDDGGVIREASFYSTTNSAFSKFYTYDIFGNRVDVTNTYGFVKKMKYDLKNNPILVSGDGTYPTLFEYDSLGLRTLLGTTRDGENWDVTRWVYDYETCLPTAKIYDDASRIEYMYTADGKLQITIDANSLIKENHYTTNGLFAGCSYSYGNVFTPNYNITYNRFNLPSVVSQEYYGTRFNYHYNNFLQMTNEVFLTSNKRYELSYAYDKYGRKVSNKLSVNGVNKAYTQYSYNLNEIEQITLTNNFNRPIQISYTNFAGYAYGYSALFPSGYLFSHILTRDNYRPNRILHSSDFFNGVQVGETINYQYDLLDRLVDRNDDSFGYNSRDEVIEAQIRLGNSTNVFTSSYDYIGNRIETSNNTVTNMYTANSLNQYALVNEDELVYDANGNLSYDGRWYYYYDAENRLIELDNLDVDEGEPCIIMMSYDYKGRRISKQVYVMGEWDNYPLARVHSYVYDDWNLVLEEIKYDNSQTQEIQYFWGNDLSGSLNGAGGVGGLIAVSIDGYYYIPTYDNNGNILSYINEQGQVVASYDYDAFGNILKQSGSQSNTFNHRFSTKYYDEENSFYYYGYRFYSPVIGRWLNRDPIEEEGGANVYALCENNPINKLDKCGLYTLSEAEDSLEKRNVVKLGDKSFFRIDYSDKQIFDEWLRLEMSRGEWWKELPKCPKKLCFLKGGKIKNPDSKIWINPDFISFASKGYHPGAIYEMRTLKGYNKRHFGNQCTYDIDGVLITTPPGAGTADFYAPGERFSFYHLNHDVKTFDLAKKLERISDYYLVRPSWNE